LTVPGPLVVVAGALANKPANGGEAWVRMSWVRGLQRLGCRVFFVEQIDEAACCDRSGRAASFADSVNRQWFASVTGQFGLTGTSSLLCDNGAVEGAPLSELREVAGEADLLVNISGNLTDTGLRRACVRRAYVDIDPGFTQMWHARGDRGARLAGHDRYFTIGTNIGSPDCLIPTDDLPWRPVRPPVVLEDWPVVEEPVTVPTEPQARFTTVATWRGPFGPIEWDRRRFGTKVHEFRKFVALPTLVDVPFEVALGIHPREAADLELLAGHRWHLVDPREVAGTHERFRQYVTGSMAEFSVAQEMYVASASGWFSDRTTRYLAAGRPALVQDTGFSRQLPVGDGLVTFTTLEEAVAGAESILADYPRHSAAARKVAAEFFDSDRVLTDVLEGCDLR
jgi:hypothetical protein